MAGQAQTVAIPKRWPLVNKLQARTSVLPQTQDARIINAYAEYDPQDEGYWIYKRLGLGAPAVVTGAVAGRGMCLVPNPAGLPQFYSVFANRLYLNGVLQSGTLNSLVGQVTMCPTPPLMGWGSGGAPGVLLNDGNLGYLFIPGDATYGVVTQLTSGTNGFTTNQIVTNFVYLDGTFYVMDLYGNVWGTTTSVDDPTTWDPLSKIVVTNDQSLGIALARQLSYVVALKQQSVEVFFDNGNSPGSPLSPVPDAQLPLGCINGYTVQALDDLLFWVSANVNSSPQLVQMANLTPKVVSTPSIERLLMQINWTTIDLERTALYGVGVYSWTLKLAGHRWYFLSVSALNITLVYDIDQELWYYWTDANGNYWPFSSVAYFPPVNNTPGSHFIQHLTAGTISPIDADYIYPTDNGLVVPVDIYTPNFDAGVDRIKLLNMMRFNADQVQGSVLQAQYSNDDYKNWSQWRTVDLGRQRPTLPDNGSFYRRAYHFRHACATPLRIKSLDLQLDIGTN